jgi:hypothetical protein
MRMLPPIPFELVHTNDVSDSHLVDSQELNPTLPALLVSKLQAEEANIKTICERISTPVFVELYKFAIGLSKLKIWLVLEGWMPAVSNALRDECAPAAHAHRSEVADIQTVDALEVNPILTPTL